MSDHASSTVNFSEAEIAEFQAHDLAAARAVVLLMLGIFGIGVGLYSIVAYWVIAFSHG